MKLTIIIGSTIETYRDEMKFFHKLEKKFKCKIKQKGTAFSTIIGNNNVEFFFCYKPQKDEKYLLSKKWWKEARNIEVPPPAMEVVKKIKKTDKILFIGFCGGISGKINQKYLPISVSQKNYGEGYITLKNSIKIRGKKIKFDNLLIGKISGKKSHHLTINQTLMPNNIAGGEKELIKISKCLKKRFDSVDMELYVLVKYFRNKFPLGAILIAYDVLDKEKTHMNAFVNKMNYPLFIQDCFESIEVMLK